MGCLRTLLAISVLLAHMRLYHLNLLVNPISGVQIFFAISGFYMALILDRSYHRASLFYLNRFFRIFPIYWLVAIGSLLVWFGIGWNADGRTIENFLSLPFGSQALLVTANSVMFTQDWVMFLEPARNALGMTFTADFTEGYNPLWMYLLSPPGWTLGIELTFYLFAPWLMKQKTKTLIFILSLSLGARYIAATQFGLNHDPWTYRFFPFELALFVWGALAYRLLPTVKAALVSSWRPLVLSVTGIYLFCLLFLDFFLGRDLLRSAIFFFPPLIFILPVLFIETNRSRIDSLIGELSYPLYIAHYPVLGVWFYFMTVPNIVNIWTLPINERIQWWAGMFFSALFVATVLAVFSAYSFNRVRSRIRDKAVNQQISEGKGVI